jgi:hypothetical protein
MSQEDMENSTALTPNGVSANAVAPSVDYDWSADVGIGMEDLKQSDISLPFWRLLQSLSPEAKMHESAYVPGAREGLWYDSIRGDLWESFVYIPCRQMTRYLEWKDRGGNSSGSFRGDHGTDDSILRQCTTDEMGRYTHRETGHAIIPTPTWYGLVVEGTLGGESRPLDGYQAVLSMPGTLMKVSRRWVGIIRSHMLPGVGPAPMYYHAWRITSIPQKNDQGSWMIPDFKKLGPIQQLYPQYIRSAKEFALLTASEQIRGPAGVRSDDDYQEPKHKIDGRNIDDEIPF